MCVCVCVCVCVCGIRWRYETIKKTTKNCNFLGRVSSSTPHPGVPQQLRCCGVEAN